MFGINIPCVENTHRGYVCNKENMVKPKIHMKNNNNNKNKK